MGNTDTNTVERSVSVTGADETDPTFAGLTSATLSEEDEVTLNWSAATDDVTAQGSIVYLIYLATSSGGQSFATPTYTTSAGATSYQVTGLTVGTTYYFVARARDEAGNTDTNTVEKNVGTYNYFQSTSHWSAYNASSIGGLGTTGYFGITFDGRYVYYSANQDVNGFHGRMLRYDTTGNFNSADSYESYDAGNTDGLNCVGYAGSVFDGRYVYFVPFTEETTRHAHVLRYDTEGSFTSSSSWEAYEASPTDGYTLLGFDGGVFDGRYVYFTPFGYDPYGHGYVLRYDTRGAGFKNSSSWSVYNAVGTSGLQCKGYYGCTFDGRYVYFVPFHDGSNFHCRALRYDTRGDFKTAGSWEAYDASSTDSLVTVGFKGAAYDGRYVYYVPFRDDEARNGRVLRYDTEGSFTSSSSWSAYDAGSTDGLETTGYVGAEYVEPYIYFVPYQADSNIYHGRALRYDTRSDFKTASSWSGFNIYPTDGLPTKGYKFSTSDGRYIYFCPYQYQVGTTFSGNVIRYDTGSITDSVAPAFGGLISATAAPGGNVNLIWSSAVDNVTAPESIRYLVYRATASGEQDFEAQLHTTPAGTTSCRVTGQTSGTTYYFVVRARDEAGNIDGNIVELSAQADGDGPTFGGLTSATDAGGGTVSLSWSAATDGVTAQSSIVYLVYRATSSGGQSYAAPTYTTGAGATTYQATGLTADTYYFVVRSRDEAGNTDTNTVERIVTVAGGDSTAPTFGGLTSASLTADDTVELDWSAATDDVSAQGSIVYLVYQATSSGGQSFATPSYTTDAGATSYQVTDLTLDTTYYFVVRARDEAENADTNTVEENETAANQFQKTANWDAFNAGSIGGLTTTGYFGITFDGRYVYYVANRDGAGFHGRMLRYDTTGDFKSAGSYESYDATNTDGIDTRGYAGAVFDGRYIYYVPFTIDTARHAHVLRYDTQGSFTAGSSWEAYEASPTDGKTLMGFDGAIYDGRYIYFTPFGYDPYAHGYVLRYDTQGAGFKSSSSWEVYNAGNTNSLNTKGYYGCVSDGRYVYFVPFEDGTNFHGRALRYDTQGDFKTSTSWEAYDAGFTDGLVTVGFKGAAYDGRYVYYVPFRDDEERNGRVLRYDTEGSFTASSSWSAYDAGSTDGLATTAYVGAEFVDPYVYFVPYQSDTNAYHGRALRYDTRGDFKTAASWSGFNIYPTDSLPTKGYKFSTNDGRYIYFCPYQYQGGAAFSGMVIRYDTNPDY